jgi:hypothetical protein
MSAPTERGDEEDGDVVGRGCFWKGSWMLRNAASA